MAFSKNHCYDVFVSYAHADNLPGQSGQGWVADLVAQLQRALAQRLGGASVSVFFDAKDLQPNHQLSELLDAVRGSAIFLAVASRAYAQRPWTRDELKAFMAPGPDLRRLFAIECLPLDPGDAYPDPLQQHKRMVFWRKNDPHGNVPLALEPTNELFKGLVFSLAENIKDQLKALNNGAAHAVAPLPETKPVPVPSTPTGKCVLLAQTTDDLEEEREQVRRHLEQYGIEVLPKEPYPQGGKDFQNAFSTDLARSDYFVQLLADKPGRMPPDLPEGYTRYQYHQACQAKVPILQWCHPELKVEGASNLQYRAVLVAETVMASTLQSFKAEIVKRCQLTNVKPGLSKCNYGRNVFVNVDRSDMDFGQSLLQELAARQCTVILSKFAETGEVDRLHLYENLKGCDVLLWIYGNATPNWVQSQLRQFNKLKFERQIVPEVQAICIGEPPRLPESKTLCAIPAGIRQIDCRDKQSVVALAEIFGAG